MIHITTTRTLEAGVDIPPTECCFCGHVTLYAGWCDINCHTCRAIFCGDGRFTIQSIRHGMKLTRRQIANEAGLAPSTIKKYERCGPSERYWEWLKSYTREFYLTPTP